MKFETRLTNVNNFFRLFFLNRNFHFFSPSYRFVLFSLLSYILCGSCNLYGIIHHRMVKGSAMPQSEHSMAERTCSKCSPANTSENKVNKLQSIIFPLECIFSSYTATRTLPPTASELYRAGDRDT